jgi:murein L,D-transpeptidase YafK
VLTEQGIYAKFKEYTICTSSGKLGPKRIQGDGQVPEGFYYINKFNPVSSFYLSLGINYPNDSDRIFGGYNPLGGDIYIHGDCKSVGCLPLTNEKMKEVYWLAVMACNNGQYRPPVHIFPMRFSNTELYMREYAKATTSTQRLWENIKLGYDYFEANRTLPPIWVGGDGYYRFNTY